MAILISYLSRQNNGIKIFQSESCFSFLGCLCYICSLLFNAYDISNSNCLTLSFTKATSQDINVVQEGAILQLAVKREGGAFRDVHVIWRLTPNAGIVNASMQISPMNGSLTFKQVFT